jgi:electron transfer flavoprotein alpha subunit
MSNIITVLFGAAGFDAAAQGILGEGSRIAQSTGGDLIAVIIGAADQNTVSLVAAVSSRVLIANQDGLTDYQPEACLAALSAICKENDARVVLLGNDTYSQEIAPRLAYRLGGSAVGDVVAVSIADGSVRATRSVYGGKASAVVQLKRTPAVIWLRARAFEPASARGDGPGKVETITLDLPQDAPTKIVERKSETGGETRLEDAQIIVSGGRGLGGPEPFKDLQQLADALGAQMAASRAACDAGWVPPSWQVGQTGKKVAPGFYLAVAISGASQHLAGISDAKVVAAINIDPEAPIFKRCRFGIVEDYRKVIPLLRERLASLQK